MNKTTVEMALKEEELKTIEDELDDNILILNDRVSYIYKNGSNHILGLLLSVKTFVEFTSNLKLVNLFAEQGNDNVHQIKDKRNAVMSIKKVMIELREKQKDHQYEMRDLVIQSGYFGGYGYSVMLYHGGGYATWYAHLSSINVSMGQMVERGKLVGLVGSTGWSTGPHLHFEIRINGAAQNPMEYLP